jgi:hypothetical protein
MPPQASRLTSSERAELRRRDAQTEAILAQLAQGGSGRPMPSHTTPSPDAYQGNLNNVLLGGRDAAIRAPTRSERAWGIVERLGENLVGMPSAALSALQVHPSQFLDRRRERGESNRRWQDQTAGLSRAEIDAGIDAGTIDTSTLGGNDPVVEAMLTGPVGGTRRAAAGVLGEIPGLGAAHRIVSPRHRPSRAENVALGLYHPVGEGKKLRVPVAEMTSEHMPSSVSMADARMINPASMEGGAIIPATGDRSRAGTRLTAVGSTPLDQPVLLEGGPDFMRTHASEGAAWASTKNALTKLANRSRQASEASLRHGGTGDVYMVYMPQHHAAVDFSAMMSDALMAQIAASKVTRRSGAAFDRVIKNTRPEWKGIFHPGAKEQLAQTGELRHEFVNAMKLDEFAGRGFPDVTATRTAIIEPALMDIPSYHGGFSVAKIDPAGRVIDAPAVPHRTYNTQLAGEYAGRLPGNVPPDVMFPDFYRSRRAAGKPLSRDIRSFLLSNPLQIATPAWVRENADFLARTGAVTALLVAGKESTPVEE